MSAQNVNFFELMEDLLNQSMLKIEHCVNQQTQQQLWWRPSESMNSTGNLLVHLAGNLKQWGVIPLIDEPDHRERSLEFSKQLDMPRQEVMEKLRAVVAEAIGCWRKLGESELQQICTIQGFEVTLMKALLHTSCHFAGHAQQIIQLTRMQLGDDYQFHWTPESERGQLPI